MRAFLTDQFGEAGEFDREQAIYWFASDYRGGQWSNLYSALCTSEYRPGAIERGVEPETMANLCYQALVDKFSRTCTCKIRWIDDNGNPMPDTNPAIGIVRTIDRREWIGGRLIHFTASEWFPICAEHAKQLNEPGMHIWEFKPSEER
jgi:hypothetical protein